MDWGYAIGTLFIRFFGIFLVLSALMLGMIVSGKIFAAMDRRAQKKDGERVKEGPPAAEAGHPLPELLAAAAAALHWHRQKKIRQASPGVWTSKRSVWAEQGRAALMGGLPVPTKCRSRR